MNTVGKIEIKIDKNKINIEVIKLWCTERLTELLGFEDDIITGLVDNYLDQDEICCKEMQINLMGFLNQHTFCFMRELWIQLESAQQNYQISNSKNKAEERLGIPQQMIDKEISKRREKNKILEIN